MWHFDEQRVVVATHSLVEGSELAGREMAFCLVANV